MKPRYIFFVVAGLVLVLGLITIFSTMPRPADKTANGTGLATPTPDTNQKLSGDKLEGQLLFTRNNNLWAWRGSESTRLAIEPGNPTIPENRVKLLQPAWSPGSNAIAYIRQDESYSDLWVVNADGTNSRSLTNHRGKGPLRSENYNQSALWAFAPSWSPDGSQIAYLSDIQTDDLALWVTAARSPQPKKLSGLAVGQGGMQHPAWSPDGTQIAVAGYDGSKPQIYTIRANNGRETRLTNTTEGALDPTFSPDGKYIAFVARRGNASDLWLMRADGSGPVQLSNTLSVRTPVFSPDSTKIAFLGLKDGGFEIFTLNVPAEGSSTLAEPKQISQAARADATGGLSWGR